MNSFRSGNDVGSMRVSAERKLRQPQKHSLDEIKRKYATNHMTFSRTNRVTSFEKDTERRSQIEEDRNGIEDQNVREKRNDNERKNISKFDTCEVEEQESDDSAISKDNASNVVETAHNNGMKLVGRYDVQKKGRSDVSDRNRKLFRQDGNISSKVTNVSNDFQKTNNSKLGKKTEFLEKVKNDILSDASKDNTTEMSIANKTVNEHVSGKRKFYAVGTMKTDKQVDLEKFESGYNAKKKPFIRRYLSTGAESSVSKNSKGSEKGENTVKDKKIHVEKMKKYDLYKNDLSTEEYLNNVKAKNAFFRNEEHKTEENNNKDFPFGNVNYKEVGSTANENLLRGNIRYNSATTSEFPKSSNLNRMEMNLLHNNNQEKMNSDLAGFNDANVRDEILGKYRNRYLMEAKYNNFNEMSEKEKYQMKNPEGPVPSNPSFYNDTKNLNKNTNVDDTDKAKYNATAAKTDMRANFINEVINEATRNGGYGEKNYQAEKPELYGRLNFNNNGMEPKSGLNDLASNKKNDLETLINVQMNANEDTDKKPLGVGGYDNIKEIKNKYLENIYENYGNVLNEFNTNERSNAIDNRTGGSANPFLGYRGGAHKRSSSSNVRVGKTDYDKFYNYLNFAADGDPELRYYREAGRGVPNGLGVDHYLQLKRVEEERMAKKQMNDLNRNMGNRNNYDDVLGNNTNNSNAPINSGGRGMNLIQNNMNTGTEGNKEMKGLSDFDIHELRKKHINGNTAIFNNGIPLDKEKNFINRKDNYLEDENESYVGQGMNEKGKLPGFITNYEDLMSFDKNVKKKGDLKSIVCVCQASKQMARLQIHMEENRHMLETEKNLMKKRKENFEKKVEMLAEKEKEIEKIHLQAKEKEMSIEKKRNEIEEKEKYVSAIKSKYDNAQKELLEKMNECITIENKCKSKLYEYDEKFGQFNKKIKEMEEREKEIEEERRLIERKEKMLNSGKQELEEQKLALLKEKNELGALKKELDTLEKEKKRMIENEYNNLHTKEEEIRRNERNAIMKEKELENRIDRYNDLIDELNKSKKEFEKDKLKLLDDVQEEKLKMLNEKKQFQMDLEHEKNNLRVEKENERNLMKEELKKERMSLMENVEKEKKRAKEELEKERMELHKTMEEKREQMNVDNDKFKNAIEQRYRENYENDKYRLEKKYEEEEHKLKVEFENKANDLKHELENEQMKITKEKEEFEKQKQMYEQEFQEKCEQYEKNIQKKYEALEEDKNKMKFLIMKEQEELENYKKGVYLDIEEEKEKLYVQEKKLNLEKENLLVEKEQIEIELKNYRNFKEKEENEIKIRIINLSQQQEDLNKEKENLEKEKEELEKRRMALDEKEECLNNDKAQIEESRQIFDEQLEKIKKNKEELLNYDKELKQREIHLIEKEKEHNKREEDLHKKQESLNSFDAELKEYSEKLQGREKKLKEKKNELQKVKDQLVSFKSSIKQKETQLQMVEAREKELLDEQTLIQIDRNSLEAEKKQFFLLKEKQEKDTNFIQEQLKLLHEQLKNKEKSLKEKENEINLLNKLQDCRNKSGKGNIISLKNPDNIRMLSANVPRASTLASRNKVKEKVIGKNKLDLMKKRNRKKSINFNYNNLDINNSIQYIDSMINENFKNKARLRYQQDNLELSDTNFIEEKTTTERRYPPRASILMNNGVDSDLITNKIANLKIIAERVSGMGTMQNADTSNREKDRRILEEDSGYQVDSGEVKKVNNIGSINDKMNTTGITSKNVVESRSHGMNPHTDDMPDGINTNDDDSYSYTEQKKGNRNFFRNPTSSEFHDDIAYENVYGDNFEKDACIQNNSKYGSNKRELPTNRNRNYRNRAVNGQGPNEMEERNTSNEGIYPPPYENENERSENVEKNSTSNKKIYAQELNSRKEKDNGLYDESDPNNRRGRMKKESEKRQQDDYLSNKNMLHSNNYNADNINNVLTNIKMGPSTLHGASNKQNTDTMRYNENKEQQYAQENKGGLMTMNINDMETSEMTGTERKYYDKGSANNDKVYRVDKNDRYEGKRGPVENSAGFINNNKKNMFMPEKPYLLQMGEEDDGYKMNEKEVNYPNNNQEDRNSIQNGDVGGNTNRGTMKGGVNPARKNLKAFRNEKVTSSNRTAKNKDPINTIDDLVNKNMQSINHMSSLMINNSISANDNNGNARMPKGNNNDRRDYEGSTVKGFDPIINNYKNAPANPRNAQINHNEQVYDEKPLKKESNTNEFLEDAYSEKYHYYPNNNDNNNNNMSKPVENNESFYYMENNRLENSDGNNNLHNNKRFEDTYDYNFNEGYEKDFKREEDIHFIESKTIMLGNKLNPEEYDNDRYENSGHEEGEVTKEKCASKTLYNNIKGVTSNTNKYENIRMMQDSGYTSDGNVLMYHAYEQDERRKNVDYPQSGNIYDNEGKSARRNNSSNTYLNKNPLLKGRNTDMISDKMSTHRNNNANAPERKKMLPPQPGKDRSSSKMNKLPLLRNRNGALNNLKSLQMNNQNNTNTSDTGSGNKRLQSKIMDTNLNKNINATRMKTLSDNVQFGQAGGNISGENTISNNIIEQLDKTLLNKSIMLTNKSKKVVNKNEESNNNVRHNSSTNNTSARVNDKQIYFYNSYNSDIVENVSTNGQNRNQKDDMYNAYKSKNTFANNNPLHMSSDIYDSNIL